MTKFNTEDKVVLHPSGYRDQTLQHRTVGEDYSMLMQIESLILKRKIDIPKLSRFNSYLEILKNSNADKRIQSYAKSEISRLILILHHVKNLDQWQKSFQIALTKDSVMPNSNEVSCIGANTLFEMYLAARFEAAGVSVNQAEPDLICEKLGFKFSVAAKRIRSKRKIESNFTKALKQIDRSNVQGIIALDLSLLHPDFFVGIKAMEQTESRSEAVKFLNATYETIIPKLKQICKSNKVIGVMAFAKFSTITPDIQQSAHFVDILDFKLLIPKNSFEAIRIRQIIDEVFHANLDPDQQKNNHSLPMNLRFV